MEIKTEIVSRGNSYGFGIPKALIDCKVLQKGQKYVIKVMRRTKNPVDAILRILSRKVLARGCEA